MQHQLTRASSFQELSLYLGYSDQHVNVSLRPNLPFPEVSITLARAHGTTYEYYYVQNYIKQSDKIRWCYLGRYETLPAEYKGILHKSKAIQKTIANQKTLI